MSTGEVEYLIIGNGVAGIAAAQEIRHLDADGRILMISDEDEPYYYRASLSGWISGQTTIEMVPGRTSEFCDQMRIEQRTEHVMRVEPKAGTVHLADMG